MGNGHGAMGMGHGALGIEIRKLLFIRITYYLLPIAHCPMPNVKCQYLIFSNWDKKDNKMWQKIRNPIALMSR